MSDMLEPGGDGVGSLVAQGVIVVFLLLLLALFIRTALLMSTLWLLPLARAFGRGPDKSEVTQDPTSSVAADTTDASTDT
jgi:hypothetical protein